MTRLDRRHFLALTAGGALVASQAPWSLHAQEKAAGREISSVDLMTPEVHKAIERGLAFLARRQIQSGREKGAFGTSGYAGGVAVCGLSGLAFMC
ncbi:MAG TPA: prenyltransferase, partial [Pirellulaceae bacterium]|nr:prenyltransferase [Pirellulaceae bacterium]